MTKIEKSLKKKSGYGYFGFDVGDIIEFVIYDDSLIINYHKNPLMVKK